MKILVTGSAGHLGEALMRTLRARQQACVGIDLIASPFTDHCGSIADAEFVRGVFADVDAVIHTATLHKPHVETHTRQSFVDTNVSGTLNLLEAAVEHQCTAFVFTSTTSVFGRALQPADGEAAVWVDESLQQQPKNIYGVTKTAAEGLCELFNLRFRLPTLVLRTSRFFPEDDDNKQQRELYDSDNLKVSELLYRRADIQDVVDAHLLAVDRASELAFDRYIISAPPPFAVDDCHRLVVDAPAVVSGYVPEYRQVYDALGWRMLPQITRIYDSSHAVNHLGWRPQFTFRDVIKRLANGQDFRSDLTHQIGSKGYHDQVFDDGPFPVEGGSDRAR